MNKIVKNIKKIVLNSLALIVVLATIGACIVFILSGTKNDDGSITLDGSAPQYSDTQKEALCALKDEIDSAVANVAGIEVPQDAGSGCAPRELAQLGANPYYSVDVSTPTAFYNAVNGRGFNEGYGYQCVAGFKQFMFALSGRYVATKTGGASGYANQQAQIEPLGFTWHSGTSGLQDGDWGIFNNGTYGHVAMYYQGKWFGQNQASANPYTGNAFNLLNLGISPVGYYRPNIYQKAEPAPTPAPVPTPGANTGDSSTSTTVDSYTVIKGDTLGGISLKLGWWVDVNTLYGNSGYTQRLAEKNGIVNRGKIYPNQVIIKTE